ncbi:MAG: GNAT family N-acetyltransferase [Betaproteobacteria bacterium]
MSVREGALTGQLSIDLAAARGLEERALNASGAFQSLVYDGWLLGYRRGPTKRLRCVNPFYASTLPMAQKVEHCIGFYAGVGLPAIFRLLPFSQPADLDAWLGRAGWPAFGRTQVLHLALDNVPAPESTPLNNSVEIVDVAAWQEPVAALLDAAPEEIPRLIERARSYPLPHAGALLRRGGEVVACGLVKLEAGYAGLFAVHTATALRGQGLGGSVVSALLAEAARQGAHTAYLQVTADNAPALALYGRLGFTPAYEYWYRARPGEQE